NSRQGQPRRLNRYWPLDRRHMKLRRLPNGRILSASGDVVRRRKEPFSSGRSSIRRNPHPLNFPAVVYRANAISRMTRKSTARGREYGLDGKGPEDRQTANKRSTRS